MTIGTINSHSESPILRGERNLLHGRIIKLQIFHPALHEHLPASQWCFCHPLTERALLKLEAQLEPRPIAQVMTSSSVHTKHVARPHQHVDVDLRAATTRPSSIDDDVAQEAANVGKALAARSQFMALLTTHASD